MSVCREAITTIGFVEQYCSVYQDLFPDVRSFEHFKFLNVGLISEIPHKSLPAIGKAVGLDNAQSLHHFFANPPWDVEALRSQKDDFKAINLFYSHYLTNHNQLSTLRTRDYDIEHLIILLFNN